MSELKFDGYWIQ